ncbi:MAG: hypothetical protein EBY20_05425 [Alphaproteobacteria bacterium]|nr:hypothetical protein [Alphaproteobacteria bacterium]
MTGNQDPLQFALFKAAKIGNIKLMREFIETGADPFLLDTENCNAITYAMNSNALDQNSLLMELTEIADGFKKNRQ